MMQIRPADERGLSDHGWLHSRHSFSFGHYHDPGRMGFSDLRVLNDDQVLGGQGFGMHAHRDMEIFSYVLDGALQHRDSMGNGSIIRPGDVQIMSAGTGVRHSEFNASPVEPVHFLQVWILPDRPGLAPRYEQRHFPKEQKRGRLQLILSPDAAEGSLRIFQDARVYVGLFDGDECARFPLRPDRHAYVHLARGRIELNGQALQAGDGVLIRQDQGAGFGDAALTLASGQGAEVLLLDLRPVESP